MGFPRQEYWTGLPFPSPSHLPNPGIEFVCSELAGRFFTTEPPGRPYVAFIFCHHNSAPRFSSVQLFNHVLLFVTPWTAARQASLSITTSQSLLKLMSVESVMPSNHLILCHSLLFLPSVFPSIRVFSNESVFRIRWSLIESSIAASASASVLPMNIQN